jgi:hypothetical protein
MEGITYHKLIRYHLDNHCNIEFIKYIISLNLVDSYYYSNYLSQCCKHGNIDLCKYFYNLCDITDVEHYFRDASEHGHMEIWQWLHSLHPNIEIYLGLILYSLFEDICSNGHLKLAQWAIKTCNKEFIEEINYLRIYRTVCQNGHLQMLQWIETFVNEIPNIHTHFESACRKGHLHICQYLYKKNYIDIKIIDINYTKENYPILKWIYESSDRTVDIEHLNYICMYDNLEFLQLIYKKWSESFYSPNINFIINNLFITACLNGKLEHCQWLYSLDNNLNMIEGFKHACILGHLFICKWLYKIDNGWISWLYNRMHRTIYDNVEFINSSCEHGNFDILIWIYNLKINIDIYQDYPNLITYFCEHNRLDLCQWLYKIDKESFKKFNNINALYIACENGYTHIVKWLYSLLDIIDRTINSCVLNYALLNGHLELGQWLHNINSYMDIQLCFDKAIGQGYFEMVKWLYNLNNAIFFDMNNSFYEAIEGGHLKLCQWLYNKYPPIDFNNAFKYACIYGHLKIAMWLYDIYPNMDIYAYNHCIFKNICYKGHIDVIKYLEQLCPMYSHSIVRFITPIISKYIIIKTDYIFTDTCPICYENDNNTLTNCNHSFCKDCIIYNIDSGKHCPLCRTSLHTLFQNVKY